VKRLSQLLLVASLTAPTSGFAQAPAASAQPAASAKPTANAQPAAAQPMPAGHPPVGMQAAPHAQAAAHAPEQDGIVAAPEVPAGTIVARIVDAAGDPLPNTNVKLSVQFQKISEGEQRNERNATTDLGGMVRFSGLATGGDYNYRISAKSGPAEYSSDPMQLKADMGLMALLHVYPVTRDPAEAAVGSIGYVFVETRADVFQFEVLFRYGNRSRLSWVPLDARMSLPGGFKAFKAGESQTDVGFEEEPGKGVKLKGTFAPGQQSASFRFQVPRHEETSASFDFGLPPHVGEIRFIAEAPVGMEIDVAGFEKPQVDVNNGQRLLVTRRVAVRGQASGLGGFTATLSGIPTPGAGRWIAVLIATVVAGLGVAAFRGKLGNETQANLQDRDAERARRVLLDELVDLERARRDGRIGPSTYESARRALVEALARIVSANPGLGKRAKRGSASRGSKKAKKSSAA
jgi:hypothetical protein